MGKFQNNSCVEKMAEKKNSCKGSHGEKHQAIDKIKILHKKWSVPNLIWLIGQLNIFKEEPFERNQNGGEKAVMFSSSDFNNLNS